jgi:hypothetical protein
MANRHTGEYAIRKSMRKKGLNGKFVKSCLTSKSCPSCRKELPLSKFYKNKNRIPPFSSYCRKCHSKDSNERAWRKENVSRSCFYSIKHGAKKRNIPVNILQNDFCEWYDAQKQKCEYCGITKEDIVKIGWGNEFRGAGKYVRMSTDRKDSSKGYSLENIVLCCMVCNIVKGMFLTHKEMMVVGKKIMRPKWKKLL